MHGARHGLCAVPLGGVAVLRRPVRSLVAPVAPPGSVGTPPPPAIHSPDSYVALPPFDLPPLLREKVNRFFLTVPLLVTPRLASGSVAESVGPVSIEGERSREGEGT